MAEEPNPSPPGSGANLPATRPGTALDRPSGTAPEEKTIPEMSDLYRHLLGELTTTFGGELDETNADAIAYAAAELYHREFEPRLWQEKSTHDLLDLFGIPRAGVFAPYSLTERVLIFQRRATQAEYVNRAHELLSTLGVPRQDEEGREQSLKWRLERFLESRGNSQAMEEDDGADGRTGDGEVTMSTLDAGDDREAETREDAAEMAGDGARGSAAKRMTVRPRRGKGKKSTADQAETGHVQAETGPTEADPADQDTGLAPVEPAEEETGLVDEADIGLAETDTGLAETDTGLVDEADTGLAEAAPAEDEEERPGEEEDRKAREPEEKGEAEQEGEADVDEVEVEGRKGEEGEAEGEGEADPATAEADDEQADELEAKGEAGEAEEAERKRGREEEDDAREAGVDVDLEPGAAPLVDAVKALEQAARVEAELAKQGPAAPAVAGAVDVERLTSTLSSIQAEMAALRTLVDTLGIEIRERLDILHEEILVAQGRLGPEPPPPTTVAPSPDEMRAADDVTRELPPIPLSPAPPAADSAEAGPGEGVATRASRRVLLVVLLVLLGLIIAGAIVAVAVFGWDQVSSQITGS